LLICFALFILFCLIGLGMAQPTPVQPEGWRQTVWPPTRNFIAGYFSGMALVLAGHPFDTVKVRLQTQGMGGRFKGPLDCVMQTVRHEGVRGLLWWAVHVSVLTLYAQLRGLYKGVSPPLFMTGIVNSVLFGLMGVTTRAVKADKDAPTQIKDIALAAVITGFEISFLVTPMEGIKARLQVQYRNAQQGVAGEQLYKYAFNGTSGLPHFPRNLTFCLLVC
jgi:solute carrier family 25 carnitine/acylcarnitine transporter 20/29